MKKIFIHILKLAAICGIVLFALNISGSLPKLPIGKIEEPSTISGNYLSARFAEDHNDLNTAIMNYGAAASKDISNPELLRRSYVLMVADGEIERAVALAKRHIEMVSDESFANLLVATNEINKGNFTAARNVLLPVYESKKTDGSAIDSIILPMAIAWTYVAENNAQEAVTLISSIYEKHPDHFIYYQKAMVQDISGNKIEAEKIFDALIKGDYTFRVANAASHFFRRNGDKNKADEIIEKFRKRNPDATAEAYENIDFISEKDVKKISRKGLAEVFLEIGGLLFARGQFIDAEIYLRMAELLDNESSFIHIMLAAAMEKNKKYDQAIKSYSMVPESSYLHMKAQISLAGVYNHKDDIEAAKKHLLFLAEKHKERAREPMLALSDMLMDRKRFGEAVDVLSSLISEIKTPEETDWLVYYARGISYERSKKWDLAEADFMKALELSPDQPDVLNYLGYSWLTLDINIDKAEKMLKTAITARPNDAHIIDSYGWALYKMKRYEEATEYIERANLMTPYDPTTNDHLGDVYWATGRETEGRYQWQRALKYNPEPEEIDKIRAKLGLSPVADNSKKDAESVKAEK